MEYFSFHLYFDSRFEIVNAGAAKLMEVHIDHACRRIDSVRREGLDWLRYLSGCTEQPMHSRSINERNRLRFWTDG